MLITMSILKKHENEKSQEIQVLPEVNVVVHRCTECQYQHNNIDNMQAHIQKEHSSVGQDIQSEDAGIGAQQTPDVECTSCTLCDFNGHNMSLICI